MNDTPRAPSIGRLLWACFAGSVALYGVLLWLGPRYGLAVPLVERPLLTVIGLYAVACVIYFVALGRAVRLPSTRRLAWWVGGTSVAMRALLLPTPPFQEIDLYRYLWDGAVVAAGADPYVYTPQQVVTGLEDPASIGGDQELARLVALAEDSPALEEILRTIHYSELPTPYPPVSQAVFAAAAAAAHHDWSAFGRLVWLKGWLTLFDLATLLLVLNLLRTTRLPIGWAIAYGWAPLVLKEVAGSGHLDAIATFFTIAALAVGAQLLVGSPQRVTAPAIAASVLLGLGVGAKLFPVVLGPLLAAALLARFGWRTMLLGAAAFLATSAVTLAPMLLPYERSRTQEVAPTPHGEAVALVPAFHALSPQGFRKAASHENGGGGLRPSRLSSEGKQVGERLASSTSLSGSVTSLPPPPDSPANPEPTGKTAGLATFLKQWEMNDLLFMTLYENLRSQAGVPPERRPWFDITPESWNAPLAGRDSLAFMATRAITLLVFATGAVALAVGTARRLDGSPEGVEAWLRAAFLTLAWFWLLAPTQNPWYWCWAMPLLPWARGRAWLAMSAVVFAYYLRFWLETHCPAAGFAGTPYTGKYFFYFVTPWLEFVPVLLWLAVESLITWRQEPAPTVARHTDGPVAVD